MPISIGVISGSTLEGEGARSVSDVLTRVGGVALVEREPGQVSITIRGVVPDSVGSPTSGYYLDEVPFSFIQQSQLPDANAFDLARVEVLRGPQGTLYGASALSGVVRLGYEFDRWAVNLYGTNLTDNRNAINPINLNQGLTSVRQRPRTIGLQATFNY